MRYPRRSLCDLFWLAPLAPDEGREDGEDQNIGILWDRKHMRQEKDLVRRSNVRVIALLSSLAKAKEPLAMDVLLRQGDLEVALKKDKHRAVITNIEVAELLGMRVDEAILSENLDNHVPSSRDRLAECTGIYTGPVSPAPFPQSPAYVIRKGYLGIRVDWSHGSSHPGPEALCIEPVDLSCLLKSKVLERILAILGLAGKEVLLVRKVFTPKDTWTSQGQSTTKEPPSSKGLDANNRRCFMHVLP